MCLQFIQSFAYKCVLDAALTALFIRPRLLDSGSWSLRIAGCIPRGEKNKTLRNNGATPLLRETMERELRLSADRGTAADTTMQYDLKCNKMSEQWQYAVSYMFLYMYLFIFILFCLTRWTVTEKSVSNNNDNKYFFINKNLLNGHWQQNGNMAHERMII